MVSLYNLSDINKKIDLIKCRNSLKKFVKKNFPTEIIVVCNEFLKV